MEIVINTNAAIDAELAKLAELEGRSPEKIGQEQAKRNFLKNLQEDIRAARKAALMRVMVPAQAECTVQAAYTPIDWAAADRPAPQPYPPIEWPAPPVGVKGV